MRGWYRPCEDLFSRLLCKAETEEAEARCVESLRRLEEDLDQHKVEHAALEKKAANDAMEGKEGKESKE